MHALITNQTPSTKTADVQKKWLLIDADGGLEAIVEHKEESADQLKVTVCNSGGKAAPSS